MTFSSVEERMVHTYLDTFPPFVPSDEGPGVESQEQFYRFMKRLYELLAANPQLLVTQLHEDDAYSNRFNKNGDKKPKLRDFMRKMTKEVDSLLTAMFALGQTGHLRKGAVLLDITVKLSKKHRAVLEQLGILISKSAAGQSLTHGEYPQLFSAWKWLATRPGATPLSFSRCFFRTDYLYPRDIYGKLLGNERGFRRLEAYLRDHGYTAIANHDGQVALDFLNLRGENVKPKCGFQYGVRFTGISASYDPLVKSPPVVGLCIPCMKDLLTHFGKVPPQVQAFLLERTRRCSGCRYCVQTDKTGKRPLARIPITHAGQTLNLCPYFPGYSYNWSQLDDALIDNLMAMLAWMDESSSHWQSRQ